MAKPRKKESGNSGVGDWINTYADMVTLLLCFFILLYSFSVVNETKWKELIQSFSYLNKSSAQILNPDDLLDKVPTETSEPLNSPDPSEIEPNAFDNLYQELNDYVIRNGLETSIVINKSDDEINIRFKDAVLFNPDSAVLRNDGRAILVNICNALKTAEGKIQMMRIEGHTAARAAGEPEFQYTFEMSVQRAVSVLRYMRDVGNLLPAKLSAVGYGQYHPIASNETEEGRIKNRRVEIIVSKMSE